MNKSIRFTVFARRASLVAFCAAALAACGGGGGGGGGDTTTPLVDPSAILQNFWSGTMTNAADGATRASAVIMPNGTAWVAMESAAAVVGVAKVALAGTAVDATSANISGTGVYFTLPNGAAQALTAAGTVTASSLAGTATSPAGTATLDWTPVTTPSYSSAAQASDLTGAWRGTLGGSVVVVDWSLDAAGTLTVGTTSTGCTYTGTVKPSSAGAIAVYDVSVAETCGVTTRNLAGIATLTASKTSLRVMYTANADTGGGVIALTKQP